MALQRNMHRRGSCGAKATDVFISAQVKNHEYIKSADADTGYESKTTDT
jgi:hypothetical protein